MRLRLVLATLAATLAVGSLTAAAISATKPARGKYATSTKDAANERIKILKDRQANMIRAGKPATGTKKYTNADIGVRFEYPSGWTVSTQDLLRNITGTDGTKTTGRKTVSIQSPKQSLVDGAYGMVSIDRVSLANPIAYENLNNDFLVLFNFDLEKNEPGPYEYFVPNMGPVTQSDITIGNSKGKKYVFSSETHGTTVTLGLVSLPMGKTLYRIYEMYDAGNRKEVESAFDHLLNTLLIADKDS